MAANINIYVKETKLNNVCGRVDYISNPERQKEKLIAVAGQQDPSFWKHLADDCRFATKNGECVEARELIVQLPNTLSELSEEELQHKLQSLKEFVDSRTGTDCIAALHDSHTGTDKPGNTHVHIIIPERELLPSPEQVVAERNLFYDETGKRRYKKSDIFENGELRPGCELVPKGTVLHERYFSSKDDYMSSQDWLYEMKNDLSDWINKELEPDRKRVVFDKESSPLIPCVHIGKGLPAEKESRIKRDNETISLYNGYVRSGVISIDDAYRFKTLIMLSPDRTEEIRNIFNQYIQIKKPQHTYQDKTAAVPRTRNKDPQKEELRAMYKQSAEIWKQYREEYDPERKQVLLHRGRAVSAEIDQRKKEMGLWQMADYKKAVAKAREEAERWRWQIQMINKHINSYSNRDYYLRHRERYLKDELWDEECKFFKDRTRIAMLKAELENVRQEKVENEQAWEVAREQAYEEKRNARMQYKVEKIKLKKAKQELREQKKLERQQRKDAKAFGLDAVLKDTAERSAVTSKNTLQPEISKITRDIR